MDTSTFVGLLILVEPSYQSLNFKDFVLFTSASFSFIERSDRQNFTIFYYLSQECRNIQTQNCEPIQFTV